MKHYSRVETEKKMKEKEHNKDSSLKTDHSTFPFSGLLASRGNS